MTPSPKPQTSIFLRRWTLSSFSGWLLGIPLLLLLSTVAEAAGLHGYNAPVGVAMGAAVGGAQARALRGSVRAVAWLSASCVGLGLPFLVVDLQRVLDRPLEYSLYASVLVGGVACGVFQALCLQLKRAAFVGWMTASALAWGLASAMVALADVGVREAGIRGWPGLFAYLGCVALGGLVLGLVSGFALSRVAPSSALGAPGSR